MSVAIQHYGREFDIDIEIDLDPGALDWPIGAESETADLGGNREYWRLPRFFWPKARKLIDQEALFLRSLHSAWASGVSDQLLTAQSTAAARALIQLDPGTNALVAALRAARCLPYYSCNAGAFGGEHTAPFPAIGFYCKPSLLPFICDAAGSSSVGLHNNFVGGITAHSPHVGALIAMADRLYRMRDALDQVDLRLRKPPPATGERQPCLF